MIKSLDSKSIIAAGVLALFMIASIAFSFSRANPVEGSTLSYAVPKVASSSLVVVGPQSVATVAATSSNCVDRVVGTVGADVQLSFSQSIVPTAFVGNPQRASTTVAYNNGDFGCGAITGYAPASTSITITTFTQ